MANFDLLKELIRSGIYENEDQEITGEVMQNTLLEMVRSLGTGYKYIGIADAMTDPGTPDENVFYFATAAGTYTHFGNLTVAANEIAILKGSGSSWSKDVTSIASTGALTSLGQTLNAALEQLGQSVNASISQLNQSVNNLLAVAGQTISGNVTSYGAYNLPYTIPAGTFIRNIGNISVRLYSDGTPSSPSGDNLVLSAGFSYELPFDAIIIRGSGTAGTYILQINHSTLFDEIVKLTRANIDKLTPSLGKNLLPTTRLLLGYKLATADSNLFTASNDYDVSPFIKVEPSTDYYASARLDYALYGSAAYVRFYDENFKNIGGTISKSFTTPENCQYLLMSVRKNAMEPMLEKGSSRGDYEPYCPITDYNEGLETQIKGIVNYRLDYCNLQADGTFGANVLYLHGVIPVKEGQQFRLTELDQVSYMRYALVTSAEHGPSMAIPLVAGTSVVEVGGKSTTIITIPAGAKYLIFNTRGSSGLYNFTLERVDKLVGEVDGLLKKTGNYDQIASWLGNNAARKTADDLTADLVLDSFPYANKFGDKFTFGCKISSFSGIKFGKGYNSTYAAWVEIDATNVKLFAGTQTATPVETVAHGLTISTMLNVSINVNKEGAAVLTLQTLGGVFNHTFSGWGYNVAGFITVKNDSSVLSDCVLTATNDAFKCPVWVFGASFEGVGDTRWPGQLKALGYFNFLLNAYPGRDSNTSILDLYRALNYGIPKYLYFAGSNDGTDSIFNANHQRIMALCAVYGITLIANVRADNQDSDYSARRTTVINSGCRYVNNYAALQNPAIPWSAGTDNWYEGFQASDGKHPTTLGAQSIAMEFLKDFPEITQY